MTTVAELALEAQRKGFKIVEDDDGGWWLISPSVPRHPSQKFGKYKTSERAWIAAALTSRDHPYD